MNKKKPMVYAFIDSQNLNLGVRSMGWKLDFKKFRLYLKNKYHVQKAFLFIGHITGNESLYEKLKTYGYLLVFKPTLEIYKNNKGKIKGNVDAELVLHTMIEKEYFDKAIIVSGDGDFHCLIDYLIKEHKLKRLLVPNRKYSSLLRRFNQYIAEVSRLKKILKKKAKISGRSKP